jgi:hypothetical protein
VRRPRVEKKAGAHIVGVDLSLTSTGMVAIPIDWDHDMAKVRTATTGYALKGATVSQQLDRMLQIAHDVLVFCVRHKAVSPVFIEEIAFGAGGMHLYERVEMIGRVKSDLYDGRGLLHETVAPSYARKILFGKAPRFPGKGGQKRWTVANVRRLPHTSDWSEDVVDAFVVANAALVRLGETAMAFDPVDL